MNSGRQNINTWGATSYRVPTTYLRPRVLNKGQPEPGKCRFTDTLADGPEWKFPNEKKGVPPKNITYGKDAKGTPISYLPIRNWATKTERAVSRPGKDSKTARGTFIDTIYFNAKKYNLPGPNKYFATKKNSEHGSPNLKDKKKLVRPNFLYDYEYLGMNIPGPGAYPVKDSWAEKAKKRAVTANPSKKHAAQNWRIKNDKRNGPGQYEITRLMTVKEIDKDKRIRNFSNIPVLERTTLGVINKVSC